MKPKIAVVIPMKGTKSIRVPGKNMRTLYKYPLYMWTIFSLQHIISDDYEVDIFIDTECDDVFNAVSLVLNKYKTEIPIKRHHRDPILSEDTANGNHLLSSFIGTESDYDFYIQTHITTPFTTGKTYQKMVEELVNGNSESVYTATWFTGWIRENNMPINYSCKHADGLGRSQDNRLIQETTDSYGFSRDFFKKWGVRSNEKSTPIICEDIEAIDIDNETDFRIASLVAKYELKEDSVRQLDKKHRTE